MVSVMIVFIISSFFYFGETISPSELLTRARNQSLDHRLLRTSPLLPSEWTTLSFESFPRRVDFTPLALTVTAFCSAMSRMNSFLTLSAAALFASAALVVAAEPKDTRVYELRIYHAAPGKLDDLNKRFRDHTVKLFEKHGMENIGYWTPIDNTNNVLIYVLAFPSRAARDTAFKEFGADPEWKAASKASEANGKLVNRVESYFMQATDYSPGIKSAKAEPRVFELREYTASEGNLAALDSRFRDHTIALFKKHGMQNIAYWHRMPDQKDANRKLIYILAHKTSEAGAASFDAFRKDPNWIKAKEDSEKRAGGSLTEGGMAGVKSTYMKPTDYSPMK